MVSGRLKRCARALIFTNLVIAGIAITAPGFGLPTIDTGPFWPLKLGHVGSPYSDQLPTATYSYISGRLSAGTSIFTNGRLAGQPTEAGVFTMVLRATEPSGRSYPVRLSQTVRRANESDLRRVAPSFENIGPFNTTVDNITVNLVSTFDRQRITTSVRVVRPVGAPGPRPLLMFHRGRGFDHTDYTLLQAHIASHGIAVASVRDSYSFAGGSFSAGQSTYDFFRPELGMQSASAVVEGVSDFLLDQSADQGSRFSGSFDGENLFMAGHSRGGGASHASHQRSFELRLKGLIYLMAFDLRFFRETAPPAQSPAYAIFADNPRTPSLIIAGENDGDLTFPIADQLLDRATGPATQVTLYGGVHNLIGDNNPAEGRALISRTQERVRTADWIVAFIKRWSEDDTDLDWRLYGGAAQGSQTVAVASRMPAARTVSFEDAQDGDVNRNLLGRNLVAGLRRRELSNFPPVGDLPNVGIRHTLLTPSDQVSIWRMASDLPLDLSAHQRLVVRLTQNEGTGWSGMSVWFRIIDADGKQSYHRASGPGLAGSKLPQFDGLSPHERFVDMHVDLDDFGLVADPASRGRLVALDMFLVVEDSRRAPTSVAVDDVRFE